MRRQRTRSCECLRRRRPPSGIPRPIRLRGHIDHRRTRRLRLPPPPYHRRRPACSARLALGVIVHEYVEHYHREKNHQVWLATRGSALKPSRRDAFTGRDPARRRRRGHDRRVDDGRDRRQGAARRQSRRRGRGEIMGQTEQDSGKTYADI